MRPFFIGGGHLEIELDLGQIAQAPDIGVLDVAAIFAHKKLR